MSQLAYTMFITNNHDSFHLWWHENFVKHQNVSKYYDQDCSVQGTNRTKHYYGTCAKNFKERYSNHTASFRNKSKEKSTQLSKYIWELKDNNFQHNLKWCIASKARHYVCGSRMCDLCLTEKLTIIKADSESPWNTRDELVSKSRHINKFTLKSFKKN